MYQNYLEIIVFFSEYMYLFSTYMPIILNSILNAVVKLYLAAAAVLPHSAYKHPS